MERPYLVWEWVDHPQLGKVEVDGWNRIWVERNAPPCLLEEIAQKHCEYSLKYAAKLLKLTIKPFVCERLDINLVRITAKIANQGTLPTYLTDQARFMKVDKAIVVRLLENTAFELISGTLEVKVPHLQGRTQRDSSWSQWNKPWEPSERMVSWAVRCVGERTFTLQASHGKSGVCIRGILVNDKKMSVVC